LAVQGQYVKGGVTVEGAVPIGIVISLIRLNDYYGRDVVFSGGKRRCDADGIGYGLNVDGLFEQGDEGIGPLSFFVNEA
jgi:hypothetical protein